MAQKRGKSYERRALQTLMADFLELRLGPWIRYQNSDGTFYCQPDAIVEERDSVFVFEVKVSHCLEAWYQLRHLYQPVLASIFRGKAIVPVEVTKSFDPAVPWPEDIELYTDARELAEANDKRAPKGRAQSGDSASAVECSPSMSVLWIR